MFNEYTNKRLVNISMGWTAEAIMTSLCSEKFAVGVVPACKKHRQLQVQILWGFSLRPPLAQTHNRVRCFLSMFCKTLIPLSNLSGKSWQLINKALLPPKYRVHFIQGRTGCTSLKYSNKKVTEI